MTASRELLDLINAMSTLTAKIALDGSFLLVNSIAQEATGLPLDELMRTNFLEGPWWAFDACVQARVRAAFTLACDGESVSYEERLMAFNRILTINLSLVPVRDQSGAVAYVVAEGRDITRRVEAEDALRVANRELEAFTYSVSHDLRAPIRHIDSFSRMLAEELGDDVQPEARHYLTRIRDGAQHMGRLVDDLLHLAHVGRKDLRPRIVSLDSIVAGVVDAMRGEARERDIDWRIDALPSARCDPGLMTIVFTNLVANAVKYTRPKATAVIEVGSMPRDGRMLVYVRDNGVGFDMTYADKLFGVFQRLHRAHEFEGTGVGLATVQRIIHKHGGEIWATADVGNGATFYFTVDAVDHTVSLTQA